jgi:hypothetical protein
MPPPLIFLDLITLIQDDEYKLWSSSLCIFLHRPVTSSLLGPNIPNTYSVKQQINYMEWLNLLPFSTGKDKLSPCLMKHRAIKEGSGQLHTVTYSGWAAHVT